MDEGEWHLPQQVVLLHKDVDSMAQGCTVQSSKYKTNESAGRKQQFRKQSTHAIQRMYMAIKVSKQLPEAQLDRVKKHLVHENRQFNHPRV